MCDRKQASMTNALCWTLRTEIKIMSHSFPHRENLAFLIYCDSKGINSLAIRGRALGL